MSSPRRLLFALLFLAVLSCGEPLHSPVQTADCTGQCGFVDGIYCGECPEEDDVAVEEDADEAVADDVAAGETDDSLLSDDDLFLACSEEELYFDRVLRWTKVRENAPGDVFAPRRGHAAVFFDGALWVMGGGGDEGWFRDVWRSQDGANWEMAAFRIDPAIMGDGKVAVHEGTLWAVDSSAVWRMNPYYAGEWERVTAEPPSGAHLADSRLVSWRGELWLIGVLGIWRSSDGAEWSEDGKIWKVSANRECSTREHYGGDAVVWNDRLLAAGGHIVCVECAAQLCWNTYSYERYYYERLPVSWKSFLFPSSFEMHTDPIMISFRGRLWLMGGFVQKSDIVYDWPGPGGHPPYVYIPGGQYPSRIIYSSCNGTAWRRDKSELPGEFLWPALAASDEAIWLVGGRLPGSADVPSVLSNEVWKGELVEAAGR